MFEFFGKSGDGARNQIGKLLLYKRIEHKPYIQTTC